MSVRIMAEVFDRYPSGGTELLLALAIADHAHDDGTHVYPSVKRLAEKTRQSERSVQYHLRAMEESGWLVLVGHATGGRGMPREYRINPAWIKGANFSPAEKGAGGDVKGCNREQERVQPSAGNGATAIAPEPSVNHQVTTKEPKRARRAPSAPIALPDWVPVDAWQGWLEMRDRNRKPPTDRAQQLALGELERLREAGNDPRRVIEQSTRKNWLDFYPDKNRNSTDDHDPFARRRGESSADHAARVNRIHDERERTGHH